MTTMAATTLEDVPTRHERLAAKDVVTIVLLAFFMLVAWTLEAYWVVHHNSMEGRHDVFARLLQIYWPADRTYRIGGYGNDKAFTLALESINTFVTQWLQIWLIYAIVKRRTYRHLLQLTVATYTFYGTVLYYYVAHLSGYRVFEYRGAYPFVLFYACNAPWLLAYGWMIYDSLRALSLRLRTVAPAAD